MGLTSYVSYIHEYLSLLWLCDNSTFLTFVDVYDIPPLTEHIR